MITLLWLDDVRDPNDPMWKSYIKGNPDKIVWVKSVDEFTKWIESNYFPSIISFDHDLADEHYIPDEGLTYTEKTGYDCAKWLIDYCIDNELELPVYYVHSMNPVGKDNILGLLNNFEQFSGH